MKRRAVSVLGAGDGATIERPRGLAAVLDVAQADEAAAH
jgi:hypothetical protein